MNKKGFTLIELLATITIIGIICVIIFPSVTNLIKGNEKSTADEIGKMMIAAAKKYVNDEKLEGTGCYSIYAKDLIEKEYLTKINAGKLTCNSDKSFVRIDFSEKNKKYSYHLSCKIKDEDKSYDTNDTTVSYCDNFTPKAKGKISINKNLYAPDLGVRENGANEYGLDDLGNTVVPTNSNMIPIRYYKNSWVVADVTNKKSGYYWYDYNNSMWANMAIVNDQTIYYDNGKLKIGTEVSMDNIKSMWVWIPRFSYYVTYSSKSSKKAKSITVKFITPDTKDKDNKNNGTDNKYRCMYFSEEEDAESNYCTPSAFTSIDEKELSGFWYSKFEVGTDCKTDLETGILTDENPLVTNIGTASGVCIPNADKYEGNVYIKPNTCAYLCQGYIESFNKIKQMTINNLDNYDIHMTSNNEWSTVLYLSYSKYGNNGEGIYSTEFNSIDQTKTGVIRKYTDGELKIFNYDTEGVSASTTNNIYGVYDMNGRDTYTTSYFGRISNQVYPNTSTQKGNRNQSFDNDEYKKYFINEAKKETDGSYSINYDELYMNNRLDVSGSFSRDNVRVTSQTVTKTTSELISYFSNEEETESILKLKSCAESTFTITKERYEGIKIRNYLNSNYSVGRSQAGLGNENVYIYASHHAACNLTSIIQDNFDKFNALFEDVTNWTSGTDGEAKKVFRPTLYFN